MIDPGGRLLRANVDTGLWGVSFGVSRCRYSMTHSGSIFLGFDPAGLSSGAGAGVGSGSGSCFGRGFGTGRALMNLFLGLGRAFVLALGLRDGAGGLSTSGTACSTSTERS